MKFKANKFEKIQVGDYVRIVIKKENEVTPCRQGEGKIVQIDRDGGKFLVILDTGLIKGMEKENPFWLTYEIFDITTVYRKEWVKL
jgi:hypothetical protein